MNQTNSQMSDQETIERSFDKSDIHKEIQRSGGLNPPRHKSQGKKIKHALYWVRGKRPTDKEPKGFIKKARLKNPIREMFGL